MTKAVNKANTSCVACVHHKRSALRWLNADELKLLDELRVEVEFAQGQRIFTQGQDNHGAYCLRTGAVKASQTIGQSKIPTIVKLASKGDLVGLSCPEETKHYHYSAEAMEETSGCFLSSSALMSLSQSVRFTRGLICVIARDLNRSEKTICNLSSRSLREKIAFILEELANNYGAPSPEGFLIELKISRKDIARISGTVVESVARILADFEQEGVVLLKGRKIIVKDREQLKAISDAQA